MKTRWLARSFPVAAALLALMAVSHPDMAQGQNGVRYDRPATGGIIFNPNIFGRDAAWDAALRYAGEFSGFRIAAGIGYANNSGNTDYLGTGFSASGSSGDFCFDGYVDKAVILHVPSGLFVSTGLMGALCNGPEFSKVNPGNNLNHETEIGLYWLVGARVSVSKHWNVQGGLSQNFFGLGRTSLYGEYGAAAGQVDIKVPGLVGASETSTGSFWGIGVAVEVPLWGVGTVQTIDAAAMELYLGYRRVDLGTVNTGFGVPAHTEIDVVTGGAKIKF